MKNKQGSVLKRSRRAGQSGGNISDGVVKEGSHRGNISRLDKTQGTCKELRQEVPTCQSVPTIHCEG